MSISIVKELLKTFSYFKQLSPDSCHGEITEKNKVQGVLTPFSNTLVAEKEFSVKIQQKQTIQC